jgi:hypothetical protein
MPNKDPWSDAWSARYETTMPTSEPPKRRRRLARLRPASRPGRYAVVSALVIAVVGSTGAIAATTGSRVINSDSRYTLYAKNTRAGDGGAGALVCNSNTGNEPCLSMVNKGNGYAAAFRTRGLTGFRLQTSGNGTAVPFVLDSNATGKVEHFNADQVDGLSAEDIGREPWAIVDGDGTPSVIRGTPGITVSRTGPGDYNVQFATDVNACSYQVTPADIAGNRTMSAVSNPGTPANNKQVRVGIKRAGGQNEGEFVDGDFQIAVHC